MYCLRGDGEFGRRGRANSALPYNGGAERLGANRETSKAGRESTAHGRLDRQRSCVREPALKRYVRGDEISRSPEALLPPHECGGCLPKARKVKDPTRECGAWGSLRRGKNAG